MIVVSMQSLCKCSNLSMHVYHPIKPRIARCASNYSCATPFGTVPPSIQRFAGVHYTPLACVTLISTRSAQLKSSLISSMRCILRSSSLTMPSEPALLQMVSDIPGHGEQTDH